MKKRVFTFVVCFVLLVGFVGNAAATESRSEELIEECIIAFPYSIAERGKQLA